MHSTQQGTLFANAFVAAPVCAPSRSCLASGREYDRAGVACNFCNDFPVSTEKTWVSVKAKLPGACNLFIVNADKQHQDASNIALTRRVAVWHRKSTPWRACKEWGYVAFCVSNPCFMHHEAISKFFPRITQTGILTQYTHLCWASRKGTILYNAPFRAVPHPHVYLSGSRLRET